MTRGYLEPGAVPPLSLCRSPPPAARGTQQPGHAPCCDTCSSAAPLVPLFPSLPFSPPVRSFCSLFTLKEKKKYTLCKSFKFRFSWPLKQAAFQLHQVTSISAACVIRGSQMLPSTGNSVLRHTAKFEAVPVRCPGSTAAPRLGAARRGNGSSAPAHLSPWCYCYLLMITPRGKRNRGRGGDPALNPPPLLATTHNWSLLTSTSF